MAPIASDIALLDGALVAVEQLLARVDPALQCGPSSAGAADLAAPDAHSDAPGEGASPAESSLNICLNSAAAMLDISRSLLRAVDDREPDERAREWQTLIVLAKSASRSAYRAALIMAAQRDLSSARLPRMDIGPAGA
jgi:hypothetical protein